MDLATPANYVNISTSISNKWLKTWQSCLDDNFYFLFSRFYLKEVLYFCLTGQKQKVHLKEGNAKRWASSFFQGQHTFPGLCQQKGCCLLHKTQNSGSVTLIHNKLFEVVGLPVTGQGKLFLWKCHWNELCYWIAPSNLKLFLFSFPPSAISTKGNDWPHYIWTKCHYVSWHNSPPSTEFPAQSSSIPPSQCSGVYCIPQGNIAALQTEGL